jgi:hypothetical protein
MDEACLEPDYGFDWDDLRRQQLKSASFRTLGADQWNAVAATRDKSMRSSDNNS